MKMKPTPLGMIVGLVLLVLLVMAVFGNEIEEKREQLTAYAAELTAYITQAIADYEQTRTVFEKENSEFLETARYNQRLLNLKQQQIDTMKELLLSVRNNDMKSIEALEKQQIINEHLFNIAALEKDRMIVIGDIKKRAQIYAPANNTELNSTIKKLETTYAEIIEREENVFAQAQYLRSLYKAKEETLADCEECFEQLNKKN